MLASAFVASWSGVIRIHGIRPKPRPGARAGVFVANHSSMIDFIILLQSHPYAVVGQKHPGWVGFLQDHVLASLKCVWFDRGESKDKKAAAERLKNHVQDPANANYPVLVFPEGTCVNNEYVVQVRNGYMVKGWDPCLVDPLPSSRSRPPILRSLRSSCLSWACPSTLLPSSTARCLLMHTGTLVSSPLPSTCTA